MKIKCDWCGSWINDFDQVCPNCGGVNNNYNRHANGVPQTIEELKAWAKEMNLPLQDMRTFIGEDYKGAKAFGIYKDETDGTFVVYKNKEDGTRAVRYKGTDEAYAVNELYQKMKERVAVQKAHQQPKTAASASRPTKDYTAYNKKRARSKKIEKTVLTIFCLIMAACLWWRFLQAPILSGRLTTDRITAITPMRIRTITIIMGTGTNGRMIPGAMHRMNPGWKAITRVTMIPTAMTAVRNMIIFRILLTTVPMMTAVMTATGMMTAGIPVGIPMTAGIPAMMTGDPIGKM